MDWQPAAACPLGPDEIHVWRFGLDRPPAHRAELEQRLSAAERRQIGRRLRPQDRDRAAAARGLLRTVLARYLGCAPEEVAFGHGPHGKPFLAAPGGPPPLEFNLSHSGGLALLAVTRAPVGIDLEVIRAGVDVLGVAGYAFAPEEQAALAAVAEEERDRAFFTAWVRKEAFLKATGQGLSALAECVVTEVPGTAELRLALPGRPEEAARWSLLDLDVGPGCVAALAVAAPGGRLVCRELGDAPWPA
jgi:4'-phosphopantetheinyl transferase